MDYNLCFFVEDIDGHRGPVVTTQVGINEDGNAPSDIVPPTVIITNPNEDAIVSNKVNITVKTADENSGIKDVQIFVDGELKSTTAMSAYLPYPDIRYELSTNDYENGDLNITAIAVDNANNTSSFSINLEVNNLKDSLWYSLPVTLRKVIFFGGVGLLGISLIIGACRKEKRKKQSFFITFFIRSHDLSNHTFYIIIYHIILQWVFYEYRYNNKSIYITKC